MARFRPGASGNPNGRPRGALSRATKTGRELAAGLLADPDYRRAFLEAWKARTVHPLTEKMVWEFALGRPPQALSLDVNAAPMPPLTINDEHGPITVIVLGVGSFDRVQGGEDGAEPLYRWKPAPGRPADRRLPPGMALLEPELD